MNRSIVGLGVLILALGVGLIAWPVASTGAPAVTVTVEVGLFAVPLGIGVAVLGSGAPDPTVTTVAGLFGNPVENALRHPRPGPASGPEPRSRGSPREPMNCPRCYTLIPWEVRECPRCHVARPCRACGGRLEEAPGTGACRSCRRAEDLCNCPRRRHFTALTGARPRQAGF